MRISDKIVDCWCRLKSKLTFPVIGDTTAVRNESFDQKLAIPEVSASARQDTAIFSSFRSLSCKVTRK